MAEMLTLEPVLPLVKMSVGPETLVAASPLMQFVYEHGHQPDSYLATAPGRETFWSSNRDGVVSYKRYGRNVLISGGLIAAPEDRPKLLREFLEFTNSRHWRASFFCIPEEDLPVFRAQGYIANKIGEDAVINLRTVTFAGKSFEWVRRQTNYCIRHGVTVEEIRPQELSQHAWTEILGELDEVCRDTMKMKPQVSELTFFDGSLGAHKLGFRRLFVARTEQADGSRIEGYVVCNPMNGGESWSTEIYRHRADCVRGTVPYLFHQIALRMQTEGVQELNLCIALARNCEDPIPGDKPFLRNSLTYFRNHFSVLFDLDGIDHFKSRFRPNYSNSYVCTAPGISPANIFATIRACGLLRISPLKTMNLIWKRLWKKRTHASAAE
ncbi:MULTISPECIES: bifunctional lysylphosphatidylglycerol flippase/synthetase MprF [unclassified Schlesneria]|uniref:bifunctional lysylphosphatidylglycerol flippase/synthetase MprF n=1 Tax=Schlesneria TaxID=656899 RepID=UPI00359F5FA9